MPEPLIIRSLRGGLNNYETPSAIDDDQVVICENIDFNRSACGGKRRGKDPIILTGSTFDDAVVFLHRNLPTSDESAAQLWGVSSTGATSVFAYKDIDWHVVVPADGLDEALGQYAIRAQSLHGKLFFAYPSAVDRLHVWDGTNLRRVGLETPITGPVVTDQGSGTYSGTRMFRVRFTIQSGGTTIIRTEPTNATTFIPSGSALSARVAQPPDPSEGETHWEVEESVDGGANWYRIATVAIGTTTYDDSLTVAEVPTTGVLSEDVGAYTTLWSPKFVAADNDRLIIAGSWNQPQLKSRVAWTPPFGAPGVGNDERLDDTTDPFLDLDGFEGGEITDIAGPIQGYLYVFKRSHIYKLIRTNQPAQSYIAQNLSKTTGAITRSVVMGQDEAGRPCLYFLDPKIGPCRIGANGIERCGEDIQGTWDTVNLDASLVSHGIFYPDAQQVWWFVAAGINTTPKLTISAQVSEFRTEQDGVHRGWSTHTLSVPVLSSVLFADNIDAGVARSTRLKPLVGVSAASDADLIQMADTGTTDNGAIYRARMVTKPFSMNSLMRRVGVMAGAVMAKASAGVTLAVKLISNYGLLEVSKTVSLAPISTEERVIKDLDSLAISGVRVLQLELGDQAAVDSDWELDMVSLKIRDEESV